MRKLVVEYADLTIAVLYPVPAAKLQLIDLLLQRFHDLWFTMGRDTKTLLFSDSAKFYVSAISALVPSDPIAPFRTEPLYEDIPLLERLFFGNSREQPQLVQLHLYDRVQSVKPKQEGGELTIADVPFPSVGEYELDIRGNLIHAFQQFGEWMYQSLDQEALEKILYIHNELSRDPDERIQEYLQQEADKVFNANADRISQFLGIPSNLL